MVTTYLKGFVSLALGFFIQKFDRVFLSVDGKEFHCGSARVPSMLVDNGSLISLDQFFLSVGFGRKNTVSASSWT